MLDLIKIKKLDRDAAIDLLEKYSRFVDKIDNLLEDYQMKMCTYPDEIIWILDDHNADPSIVNTLNDQWKINGTYKITGENTLDGLRSKMSAAYQLYGTPHFDKDYLRLNSLVNLSSTIISEELDNQLYNYQMVDNIIKKFEKINPELTTLLTKNKNELHKNFDNLYGLIKLINELAK